MPKKIGSTEATKSLKRERNLLVDVADVNPNDLWIMILSTIRYSMGRMTYMSSLAPELVLKYADHLLPVQLHQIANEIESELVIHHKCGKLLGMLCDDLSWKNSIIAIRNKAEQLEKHANSSRERINNVVVDS